MSCFQDAKLKMVKSLKSLTMDVIVEHVEKYQGLLPRILPPPLLQDVLDVLIGEKRRVPECNSVGLNKLPSYRRELNGIGFSTVEQLLNIRTKIMDTKVMKCVTHGRPPLAPDDWLLRFLDVLSTKSPKLEQLEIGLEPALGCDEICRFKKLKHLNIHNNAILLSKFLTIVNECPKLDYVNALKIEIDGEVELDFSNDRFSNQEISHMPFYPEGNAQFVAIKLNQDLPDLGANHELKTMTLENGRRTYCCIEVDVNSTFLEFNILNMLPQNTTKIIVQCPMCPSNLARFIPSFPFLRAVKSAHFMRDHNRKPLFPVFLVVNGQSLTEFKLTSGFPYERTVAITLGQILRWCPNLRELEIVDIELIRYDDVSIESMARLRRFLHTRPVDALARLIMAHPQLAHLSIFNIFLGYGN